jgi:hypothetical protein
MTASDMRLALERLTAERHVAAASPLAGNATYMDDLESDLAAAHAAYVGVAVTEIASFRGELSGRPQG